MKMPIKRFWLLSGNVDRIEAQRAVRTLTLMHSAQGDAEQCRRALIEEIGTISTGVSERDEEGFSELKKLQI